MLIIFAYCCGATEADFIDPGAWRRLYLVRDLAIMQLSRDPHVRHGCSSMFEYIFFHPQPAREFADWLKQQGVSTQSRNDGEGFIVEVPEGLDDALDHAIDEKYEALLEMNEALLQEERGDEAGYHMAGITVHLKDGRACYADIDPNLLGRVMGCVTPEEFATIVDAIVSAVENPQERTYCQRQRDEEQE